MSLGIISQEISPKLLPGNLFKPQQRGEIRRQRRQEEVVLKLMNKSGKMVRYEVKEPGHKVVMPKTDEDPVGPKTAPVPPRFKPKAGSVFPAKRRSVKRMMLDSFIQFLARNFRSPGRPSSSAASQSKNFRPPKSANAKQGKIIHPSSP